MTEDADLGLQLARRGARVGMIAPPTYWPLQSVAMARALYGLCHAPHFWAKTPHGTPSS